jgi:hypothetical protein
MNEAVRSDTLRTMYLREAVTEMVAGGRLREWTGDVGNRLRRAWDAAIHNLEFDGAMHKLPNAWLEQRDHKRVAVSFASGPVQINPFKMDALDCLRLLVGFAADQTAGLGPDKHWSPETHRLFAQARSAMRFSGRDIDTADRIIGLYLGQIAQHVADAINADKREVHEILAQRYEREEFTKSQRVEFMRNDNYDFRDEIFLWSVSDESRVHIPFGRDLSAYLALFEEIRNKREYRGFYTKDKAPINVQLPRTINGTDEGYPFFRFPNRPEIAKRLLDIARRKDADAIVCHSLIAVAAVQAPSPIEPARDIKVDRSRADTDDRRWKP